MAKVRFGWVALCALGASGAAAMGCGGGTTPVTDSGMSGDAMSLGDTNVPLDARVDGGRDGGGDGGSCTGLTLCTTVGTSCDASTLVTCADDANGCRVETRTACSATSQVCSDASGTAACVDPCSLIPVDQQCTAEGRTCAADVLSVCAMDANGCLVRTDTDCAGLTPASTCGSDGTMNVCLAVDPCMGMTPCGTSETRVCTDATTLTVCAANPMGCFVETVTTCTGSTVCDSATTTCVDPCAGLPVCPSSSYCDSVTGERVTCMRNLDGCLLESTRAACTGGAVCDASSGPAVCQSRACPEAAPTVLDCGSGTVNGDTASGSMIRTSYTGCTTDTLYGAAEQIFAFQNAQNARVTIAATRLGASGDYDLFAIPAGTAGLSCGDVALTCEASGTTTGGNETMTFDIAGGETEYIVYDLFDATGTTTFTLDVTCVVATCGNGMVEGGETCDDGNTADGDRCSSNCQVEPGSVCYGAPSTCAPALQCGNGVTEMGETCDDGNSMALDGCSDLCAVEAGYRCTAATPSVCTRVCGNSVIDSGETCDDANFAPGDGCSAACTVEAGFACYGGPPSMCFPAASNATCATARLVTGTSNFSGDTRVGGGPFAGTGCTSGGGGRGVWYQLDVPARTSVHAVVTRSGWDAVLEIVSSCGATGCAQRADDPEDLVFVNGTSSPVTTYAFVSAYASGGIGGVFDVAFTYTTAVCGNGAIEAGETCDDMNGAPGDGCSDSCTIEAGYTCTGSPSVCTISAPNSTCATATPVTANITLPGDTRIGGPAYTGTGCTSSGGGLGVWYALTIPAYTSVHAVETPVAGDLVMQVVDSCGAMACSQRADDPETLDIVNATGAPITRNVFINAFSAGGLGNAFNVTFTYVPAICGNGTREPAESCDDNNMATGDGCSDHCQIEAGYRCTGTPSVCTRLPYLQTSIPAACVTGGTWTSPMRSSSTSDDAVTGLIALPFGGSFFGTAVTQFSASTNGLLQLYTSAGGTPSNAWTNANVGSTTAPNGYVAPFWDDLYLGTGYDLHYQTTGTAGSQVLVVEWLNALAGSGGSPITFQVMLYEATGVIEVHYCSIGSGTRASGDSATVGLENAAGNDGIATSYNTGGCGGTGGGYRYTPN